MRKSVLTGRRIVSNLPPNTPFPVYHLEDWWKHPVPRTSFGRDIDFNRPFFDQFLELRNEVPAESVRLWNCHNTEFANYSTRCKNCCMVWSQNQSEECLYIDGGGFNKNSILGWSTLRAECSYAMYRVDTMFQCYFCDLCWGCSDSWYLRWCKDCHYCFGCCHLNHKRYCIFNKQVTKEEYLDFMKGIDTGSRVELELWRSRTLEFFKTVPEMGIRGRFNEDVASGDVVFNCKRAERIFSSVNCEDCKDIYECSGVTHGYDMDNTSVATGLCYQNVSGTTLFNCQFTANSHNCSDSTYLLDCFELKRCFGCIGLYNQQYCILNKHYSYQAYYETLQRLVQHMIKTGEWGEFFRPDIARYNYTQSTASGFYPISKEEALKHGFKWGDYAEPLPESEFVMDGKDVPDNINDISDDILKYRIKCPETGRHYRIQKQELAFYRTHHLPVPNKFPNKQMGVVYSLRNPLKLVERQCQNTINGSRCSTKTTGAHPIDNGQLVYCEECFNQATYHD